MTGVTVAEPPQLAINPGSYIDQSTIISIYPHPVNEFKPGLYPGRFQVDACKNEDLPMFSVIGLSIHLVYIADKPPLAIETASFKIAQAVVRDFFDTVANRDNTNLSARPGIACLPGKVGLAEFKAKHSELHNQMKKQQDAWGMVLVRENDNNWNRYRNHKMMLPLGIYFAKKFNLTESQHPWMIDSEAILTQPRCPVCQNPVTRDALVCTSCSPNFILKPEEYAKITAGRLVKA